MGEALKHASRGDRGTSPEGAWYGMSCRASRENLQTERGGRQKPFSPVTGTAVLQEVPVSYLCVEHVSGECVQSGTVAILSTRKKSEVSGFCCVVVSCFPPLQTSSVQAFGKWTSASQRPLRWTSTLMLPSWQCAPLADMKKSCSQRRHPQDARLSASLLA